MLPGTRRLLNRGAVAKPGEGGWLTGLSHRVTSPLMLVVSTRGGLPSSLNLPGVAGLNPVRRRLAVITPHL